MLNIDDVNDVLKVIATTTTAPSETVTRKLSGLDISEEEFEKAVEVLKKEGLIKITRTEQDGQSTKIQATLTNAGMVRMESLS